MEVPEYQCSVDILNVSELEHGELCFSCAAGELNRPAPGSLPSPPRRPNARTGPQIVSPELAKHRKYLAWPGNPLQGPSV